MRAKDYRNQAWGLLKKNNYWMLFLITLIFLIVTGASTFIILFVVGALSAGLSLVYLRAYRTSEEPKIETMFQPFATSYTNTLVAVLLTTVFVFLWSLLLLIPGIIKSYAYSMTKYILADNPELDGYEAMKQSEHLMIGNKWRLFCLQFSFIGWILLSLGIGFIFIYPYIVAAETAFYLDLVNEKVEDNKIIEEVEVVEL